MLRPTETADVRTPGARVGEGSAPLFVQKVRDRADWSSTTFWFSDAVMGGEGSDRGEDRNGKKEVRIKNKPTQLAIIFYCFQHLVPETTAGYTRETQGGACGVFTNCEKHFVTEYFVALLQGCGFSDLQRLALGH